MKQTQNLDVVRGLKPEALWDFFADICNIPHGSKNESAVADLVCGLAAQNAQVSDFARDEANNVVVYLKATPGFEERPSVCLQGHLDMVCEKLKESTHNFETDSIELVLKDGQLMANGTTLGADNGIGAATMLAIMMDVTIEHGPLELLFTTMEEIGFEGAAALNPALIDSKIIINLDSEEEGEIFVGCAGGGRVNGMIAVPFVAPRIGMEKYALVVKGLAGGHSGLEINLGRANAIKLLARVVDVLRDLGAQVISLKGGNKMNAIPREAEAVLLLSPDRVEAWMFAFEGIAKVIREEFAVADPGIMITLERVGAATDEQVIEDSTLEAIVDMLMVLPHGVIRMDPNNDKLVETSNNVGILATEGGNLVVTCMFRSSVESQMDMLQETIKGMAEKAGGTVEVLNRYAAWEPRFDAPLLVTAKEVYLNLYGVEPAVKTIHAGLECALFYRMFPGAEIISFGPTMAGVHTPDEKVDVASVWKFWSYLTALLQAVGESVDNDAEDEEKKETV